MSYDYDLDLISNDKVEKIREQMLSWHRMKKTHDHLEVIKLIEEAISDIEFCLDKIKLDTIKNDLAYEVAEYKFSLHLTKREYETIIKSRSLISVESD